MLPTINGKSFLDCDVSDLQMLIDNPDYRECEYIDYKATFSFLEYAKGDRKRTEHLAEFRSDICSFANAEGGYLLYGISDRNGMANELCGIEIQGNNTDRFELDRKNNLSSIMPQMPPVKFKFILLENGKYVVIIAVSHDAFSPYIHLEDESNYRIYRRMGNGKRSIGYMELRNMFLQSRSLENEILNFRKERISFFCDQNETVSGDDYRFLLLHIFPETFTDPSHNKSVFSLERSGEVSYASIFIEIGGFYDSIPNVEGLRYRQHSGEAECSVGKNGSIECFVPLDNWYISKFANINREGIAWAALWDIIQSVVANYSEVMLPTLETPRFYVCISIVGCKGLITEHNGLGTHVGSVDRNRLICSPVTFDKTNDFESTCELLKIEYLLSMGIKRDSVLTKFVNTSRP